MSIGLTPRREPAPIPEATLWTLRRNGRVIDARARILPSGKPELRFYFDGELFHSAVVREVVDIAEVAGKRRAALQALGWWP